MAGAGLPAHKDRQPDAHTERAPAEAREASLSGWPWGRWKKDGRQKPHPSPVPGIRLPGPSIHPARLWIVCRGVLLVHTFLSARMLHHANTWTGVAETLCPWPDIAVEGVDPLDDMWCKSVGDP